MNIYTDFKQKDKIEKLASIITKESDEKINIMEICGGHTHSIMKYGLNHILKGSVNFIHGPGCPVCVMPVKRIDTAIDLSRLKNTIIASYGDMIRVPGSESSLIKERANGSDIRMIYSPLDVLKIAKENPDKSIIFFAIGFETTTPMTAALLENVIENNIKNIFFYINHVLVPPPIEAILASNDTIIDGFIGPGHVSVITGAGIYKNISIKYKKPVVITGFEPFDILSGILLIIRQINKKLADVEIAYKRAVSFTGNRKAQELVNKYFAVRDNFEWRGLGNIPNSALKLKDRFRNFDAEVVFNEDLSKISETNKTDSILDINMPSMSKKTDKSFLCKCGDILKGKLKPIDCKLFANVCNPENPIGACMVSNEGACAAYYKYYNL